MHIIIMLLLISLLILVHEAGHFFVARFFKIKVEATSPEIAEEAHEKIKHFSDKFKVTVNKLDNKETYYIIGFNH